MDIQLKRAYEEPAEDDGPRFLVDRLWPRGVSKETLRLAGWLKDVAPSNELRKWFGHDPERWEEFRKRYRAELDGLDEAAFQPLLEAVQKGRITLVYGARDEVHNQAVVLRDFLSGRGAK